MLSVVIIGTGNVAQALCQAWQGSKKIEVKEVVSRNPEKNRFISKVPVIPMEQLNPTVDCYIIAVNDSGISAVNQGLKDISGLVVHTSGSQDLDVLSPRARRGVLYPLQTFSAGRNIDFKKVPLFLEVHQSDDAVILEQLGRSLTKHIHWLDSSQRAQLHLAAVFLNNFTNHLLYQAGQLCRELPIDAKVFSPLLTETIDKATEMGPYQAQTGPARRGDQQVLIQHMSRLTDPMQCKIYHILSESIQTLYENELPEPA